MPHGIIQAHKYMFVYVGVFIKTKRKNRMRKTELKAEGSERVIKLRKLRLEAYSKERG